MRRPIVWILLLAVVLRLVFALGIMRGLMHVRPEQEITDGYERIAVNLLHGLGYRQIPQHPPTLERPPAYPVLLWLLFHVAGVNYVVVQVVQALLGALGAWLLYLLGRWVLREQLGLWAAGLYAVHLTSIEYAARLYAENLYIPLFLALAWLLCRAIAASNPWRGLAAGGVFSLGLLTRGTLLAFPPFLLAGLPLVPRLRGSVRRWGRWLLPAALAGALTLAPWIARNWNLTGSFVPISSWGWAPFYHGLQCSKGMLRWADLRAIDKNAEREREAIVIDRLYGGDRTRAYATSRDYVRHEKVARALVLEEIRRDPLGFTARGLVGIPFSWFQTLGPRKRIASLFAHLPLMILFGVGVARMERCQPSAFARAWPALLLVLFVTLFQGFVFPLARYAAPAVALSFLWSGFALDGLLQRGRSCG